jgi:HAE1 family hydrophobic/amphiphilic exporter-1
VDKHKQVLETVEDVGEVTFTGDRHREIQLLLDEDRMNAYGLSRSGPQRCSETEITEIPSGTFSAGPNEISLRTGTHSDRRGFQ